MKDLKIYLSIATVLLIFYVAALYNRPKAIDWSERLFDTEKTPFSTYILYNRLNDIFPNAKINAVREPVYNVLGDENLKGCTYILIANYINPNKFDYQRLEQFIKNGNEVFIAASGFGSLLNQHYKISSNSEFTSAGTRLVNKSLDTAFVKKPKRNLSNNYFSDFDTSKMTVLGKNNLGHVNFLKCTIGKGTLYLNANALLYSNYALANSGSLKYAQSSLSYLKSSNNVLWDEFYTRGRAGADNPLRVFLDNASLKWAFYLTYASLLIFVLFQVKRRQRIIPVIEPLKNATVDFVTVVGQVYYEQRDNNDLAQKKILYFLDYLRTQYYLKTNKLDIDFIESLSNKTGVSKPFATELVNHINYISQQTKVNDHELIVLNQLIEKFYSQS
ncbi:MAG: hypothetical protein JWR50_672 [Mucilaginibacter sp.]|nr:hypothetical protein [Mucilaginibacter sp.]